MKFKLLIAIFTISISYGSYTFCQVSFGAGMTTPLGSFQDIHNAAAGIGYQVSVDWDLPLNERYGIATGVRIGQNSLKDDSNYLEGSWSQATIEAGAFYSPTKNLRFKSLVTVGNYATPVIGHDTDFGGGALTINNLGLGLDLKVEYRLKHWLIGTNFFYSKNNLDTELINGNRPNTISISNLGFSVGYVL